MADRGRPCSWGMRNLPRSPADGVEWQVLHDTGAAALSVRGPYFEAEDRNATSAWIWLGLRVLEKVFGMIPAL